MQDLTDDDRKQVLGEVLMDEFRVIREMLGDLPTRTEFNQLKERVDEIGGDVEVIKLAVTDQSRQLKNHEHRITALEAA
jgi:hypothetical protein